MGIEPVPEPTEPDWLDEPKAGPCGAQVEQGERVKSTTARGYGHMHQRERKRWKRSTLTTSAGQIRDKAQTASHTANPAASRSLAAARITPAGPPPFPETLTGLRAAFPLPLAVR